MHRRTLLQIAAAIPATTALAMLTGCSTSTSTDATTGASASANKPLKIALSWIKNNEFAGEYMADSAGYYTHEGIPSVDLIAGGGSTTVESLLLSGGADVGLSSAPVTAAANDSSDAGFKIIGATYQKNPFGIASLKNHATFTSAQDLTGKTIGVQSGANQLLFEAFLKANNLDPALVKTVGVEYDWAPLTEGKVDGFLAYITDDVTLASLGHPASVLSFAEHGLPFVAETLTVLDSTIAQRREELKAFLRAEIRGWTDAIQAPKKAIDLTVDTYGADQKLNYATEWSQAVATMDRLIVSDNTAANGLLTMSDAMIGENIASLKALGYDLNASDLFDMSLLREVYQNDPSLKVALRPTTDFKSPR